MSMRRPLLRLTMALSLSAGVFVHAADDFLLSRFSEYLNALRAQAGIPGLAAAIVGSSDVTWEGMFGFQDVERNLPVRFDTPFQLDDTTQAIVDFLKRFAGALGVNITIDVDETPVGPRLNLAGEEAEILVRHRGEPLKALQHVLDMAYGRTLPDDKRVFVDALEYRKGKDLELRQMAKLLAEKVKETGVDQQLGPLNPYERRIVHLAVAELSGVTTESVGDAFSKTVLISLRK